MYGGRCNGTRLHVHAEDGEKIHYVDFTSLYPSVLRDERYPVDHPEIITGDFKPLDQYFGLAYVKILPPTRLYHPVLPFRVNNKLYFPLCRTCATSNSGPGCDCSDDDRALIGTWCTPELLKAVEMGYRIMKIYEVYQFPGDDQVRPSNWHWGLVWILHQQVPQGQARSQRIPVRLRDPRRPLRVHSEVPRDGGHRTGSKPDP